MGDTKTIKLGHSIPVKKEGGGTVQVSELTLGRLKAKHFKLMPAAMFDEGKKDNVRPEEMIPLIAALANISVESAEEIDAEDLIKLASDMTDFFGAQFPETGKK